MSTADPSTRPDDVTAAQPQGYRGRRRIPGAGGVPVTALLVAASVVALVLIVGAIALLPGRTSGTVPPAGSDNDTGGAQVVPQPNNPGIAVGSSRPARTGGTGTSGTSGTTGASPSGPVTAWQTDHHYGIGDRVTYAGHVYQCRQAHTSLAGWEPPNAPALWQSLP